MKLGVVELVEAVLGNAKELLRSRVLGHGGFVLLVLGLALIRGLDDGLIKGIDAGRQGSELLGRGFDEGLRLLDGLLQVRGVQVEFLIFVLIGVNIFLAIHLLVVVIDLLLTEQSDHLVNHGQHLVEVDLLAAQSQRDEVQAVVVAATERLNGHVAHLLVLDGHLQERGARQGGFKKFKCIVIIQDLDGLSDRQSLLGTGLLHDLVLLRLGRTVLVQVNQELFVLLVGRGSVLQVLPELLDLDTSLAKALRLLLNGLGVRRDLLLLGRDQTLIVRLGLLLRLRDIGQVRLHGVLHLLEDARDLAALRGVALTLALRQEGGHHVTVRATQVHVDGQAADDCSGVGLQEAAACTLRDEVDGLAGGRDVGLVVAGGLREDPRLLLSQGAGLLDGSQGILAVLLVLHEVCLELRLLRRRLLQGAGDGRHLGLGGLDRGREVRSPGLTVAHELVIELLAALALLDDLRLHALQHRHHAANGVHGQHRATAEAGGISASGQGCHEDGPKRNHRGPKCARRDDKLRWKRSANESA
mmetsp:Transcript_78354/g.253434  ORF Transcript_78354/g.253434 Transcript_78354/m.253434 type:complete len:528 (+) Transcript_78354:707-2290(+)